MALPKDLAKDGIPSRIHIPYRIYSIHSTFMLVQIAVNQAKTGDYGFGVRIALYGSTAKPRTPMPQEISVSYQAIKSKVYRLIDALVVGEKSEAEVQESVRRWWSLIHPADRPIAQKYLLMVLGRSNSALDAMGTELLSVSRCEPSQPRMTDPLLPTKRMRLIERTMKENSVRTAI
jgi:hypothetical protein